MTKQIALCKPDRVHLVTGSEEENASLLSELVRSGVLVKCNETNWPGCYLARSTAADVARVEARTFICSEKEGDAGPTNNWMDPQQMRAKLTAQFDGSMKGRTMYVVPFSMGPLGSPLSAIGVQVTDSPYVVVNTRIMARIAGSLAVLGERGTFVPCIHSVGVPLARGHEDTAWPQNADKTIAHFPETREIMRSVRVVVSTFCVGLLLLGL